MVIRKGLHVLILLLATRVMLSGQIPHISGNINIDTKIGLIQCNLEISHVPAMEDLTFALNKGFNLKNIKADNKTVGYNIDFGVQMLNTYLWDALSYVPLVDTILSNTRFQLNYSGGFPTYGNEKADNNYSDGQVNIAIKNRILRASFFTKWYPFLYDRANNQLISKFTYNLHIVSDDSTKTIYINGSLPHKGNDCHVSTDTPNNLLIYIGDYTFSTSEHAYFLNSSISENEHKVFDDILSGTQDFYNTVLNKNGRQKIILGQLFSIGRENEYADWALAEYPAILTNLESHASYFKAGMDDITTMNTFRLYAHELAHQYWGLALRASNNYWAFYSESFAEYFALKAVENRYGKDRYHRFLQSRYLHAKQFDRPYPQLDRIAVSSPKSVNAWYNYYPMVLLGLEQVVGQNQVFALFRFLLENSVSSDIDYDYFRDAALKSGISLEAWTKFELDYVKSENCLFMVKERL